MHYLNKEKEKDSFTNIVTVDRPYLAPFFRKLFTYINGLFTESLEIKFSEKFPTKLNVHFGQDYWHDTETGDLSMILYINGTIFHCIVMIEAFMEMYTHGEPTMITDVYEINKDLFEFTIRDKIQKHEHLQDLIIIDRKDILSHRGQFVINHIEQPDPASTRPDNIVHLHDYK